MEMLRHIERVLGTPLLHIRDVPVSPMLLIQAAFILLVTWIFSRLLTRFLRHNIFNRYRIGVGVQESISRVIHYFLMLLGTFIALEHVGIDLTALAAVSAVLMVGIGFGLQNIASNFISGLILLFERPIQVGDFVEVDRVLGKVTAINARSTTVVSLDNVAIIVPNSKFVSENVTNWSYRDPSMRLHIRVRAAYGVDVDRVRDTLLSVGEAHTEVLKKPVPSVQFYEFGDSALLFVLLVWIDNPQRQLVIRSELNFAVVRAFHKEGIRIPFPQRDVHLHPAVPLEVTDSRP